MADEIVSVNEFQVLARQALPKMYYDFYAGGAEDEHTLKKNVQEFQRIILQPRVLVDVSNIAMSTNILGYTISAPIMIAPTSMHKLAHPEGELATARAAAEFNTIMILSFSASSSVEEVAASCDAVRFFQLYVLKRRDIAVNLVQRAEKSGYKAIVLTADRPRRGRKEADIKNKMNLPQLKNLEGLISIEVFSDKGSNTKPYTNEIFDSSFCWRDIAWLKSITNLPILIKGILTREDATKAMEVGAAGIIVSNHGGRQLDYTPATISVLEEVVQAVGRKVPVLLDGGIRRGTDVFKALALGAQAVLVGRPVIYGLAAKGEAGVRKVMHMLKDELELTMALAGCPTLKDISRSHVRTDRDRLQSLL
ncbi:hypothetical protein OIU76_004522 [Salix suchowensis]|nr:(S)-2-hydroxy-acid oxidase family protein [Salix suchowensis]KAJ6348052.1 hypothetical protein OIU76_004522 [Salix suchowensis]KAJ6348053.1 hypothetical protein OIU76_004522 [Salix suchowensis]